MDHEDPPSQPDGMSEGERYRTLYETIPLGVVFQKEDGQIISANPAAERILGLTIDQMMGRTSIDPRWKAIHEDGSDFPGNEHPAMVALRTRENIDDVVMGVFNPILDRYKWINVCARPICKEGKDEPYLVYATFEDISEKRLIEKNLREKESAISTSISGIAFGDTQGKITYVNDSFLKMWGYLESTEVVGRDATEFWHLPDDAVLVLSEALEGRGWNGELVALRKDGSSFVVQVFSGPIFDTDGKVISIMGTFVDITEDKQQEIERERQNRELELFSSLLRHDIGNDLQVLLTHIETMELLQEECDLEDNAIFTPIKSAIARIMKLLHTFGRPFDTEDIGIVDMLEETAETSQKIHKNLRVKVKSDRRSKRVPLASRHFLHAVFENLLRNSAEHSDAEKVNVHISVNHANGNLIIEVQDDGSGIDEAIKQKLFERGVTTNGGGLGLYLTRQVLAIYDGTIEYVARPKSKGTCFSIKLPII